MPNEVAMLFLIHLSLKVMMNLMMNEEVSKKVKCRVSEWHKREIDGEHLERRTRTRMCCLDCFRWIGVEWLFVAATFEVFLL